MEFFHGGPRKSLALLMGIALILPSTGGAATKLANPKTFKSGNTIGFNVTSRGWSDLNFVGQGWTHNSQFGQVKLRKRQTLSIKVISADQSLHPGLTVWYRPATASGNNKKGLAYVPTHNFPQTADWDQKNARDEETQKRVGNIIMKYMANGYDADGNDPNINVQEQVQNPKVVSLFDGVPGTVELKFKASKAGVYQFAVGGINPYPVVLPNKKYPVTVQVNISK
ncbi:MAG: copper(I)-binding protein CorA [Methylococcus sp.]